MAATCPRCGEPLRAGARVCRHCLHILDRAAWAHDAGGLGPDGRGGGREPEEPPIGPIPLSGSGLAGGVYGAANAGLRLITLGLLGRGRR